MSNREQWEDAVWGLSELLEVNNLSPSCYPNASQIFMPLYALNTSPFPPFPPSLLTPFLPIHRLTRPQRCPHYGPLQEPPQCPSKAEWHSIAMEKLSWLCDWLLVNKAVSAVWGLWGANYRREQERITMTGSEKGLCQREKRREQIDKSRPKYTTAYPRKQKDLLISHRKLFNPPRNIKPLDINRFHKCICITKRHIRQFPDRIFACFNPNLSVEPIAVKPLPAYAINYARRIRKTCGNRGGK